MDFILLIGLTRFELGAMWEDLKFDLKHKKQYGEMAVVGDKKWEEWVIKISRPFFSAEIRYFPVEQETEARGVGEERKLMPVVNTWNRNKRKTSQKIFS